MHAHAILKTCEQPMQIKLPPGRVVLTRIAVLEASAEIAVSVGEDGIPVIKLASYPLPYDAGCPVEERETVLRVQARRRVRALDVVE
jgi:hypothetical protein